MSTPVVVREYAVLTTQRLSASTLDKAQISKTVFDWLIDLGQSFRRNGLSLLQLDNHQALRLDSYVGVLESPCGQVIEILPKTTTSNSSIQVGRRVLKKLILNALDIKPRKASNASLMTFDVPIREWLIERFLFELNTLVKRGLQFEYQAYEEQAQYLRGRLNVAQQLRQGPGKDHVFNITHDQFVPHRPENKLIKLALTTVSKLTKNQDNWRLSHELLGKLYELKGSASVEVDFRAWDDSRLLAHYKHIKPWCECILRQHTPFSISGGWQGISLLFPMERLFEKYVAAQFYGMPGVTKTKTSMSLCTYHGQKLFPLRPDIQLKHGKKQLIVDTKWKRVDLNSQDKLDDLKIADFYQMFAYGHKYLEGVGDLILVYPAWDKLAAGTVVGPYQFSSDLNLWVASFDVESEGQKVNCRIFNLLKR